MYRKSRRESLNELNFLNKTAQPLKSTMSKNTEITTVASITVEAPVFSQFELNEQASVKSLTVQELREEMFFRSHNKLQKDGRINGGYDSDGLLLAHSISPEYKEFRSQIEEGIYPVVNALARKGYFPISSCEGHPYGAIVKIGFGSVLCRDYFISQLSDACPEFIEYFKHEYCMNLEVQNPTTKGHKLSAKRVDIEGGDEYLSKINTDGFNFQFNTHFKSWHFLDLIILKNYSWWSPLKRRKSINNLHRKSEIINSIANAVCAMDDYNIVFGRSLMKQLELDNS